MTHRTVGSVIPERCLWKALERTAHASASLRVMMARALLSPLPGHPCGPNVRCKKTYRATQRTNLLASVTS